MIAKFETHARRAWPVLVSAGLILAGTGPAMAHKLLLSYWFSDGEVVGEIGLSNGTFAKDAAIEISQANGEMIAVIRSDENGLFRFRPQAQEPHRFYANLGSGHIAKFTVSAEEIEVGKSGALLGGSGLAASGQELPEEMLRARVPMPNSGIAATDQNAIKGLIRQELTPLRREIIALREKNGLQSILGGIGYIVGLFGLVFFWMGRQAAKSAADASARGGSARPKASKGTSGAPSEPSASSPAQPRTAPGWRQALKGLLSTAPVGPNASQQDPALRQRSQ